MNKLFTKPSILGGFVFVDIDQSYWLNDVRSLSKENKMGGIMVAVLVGFFAVLCGIFMFGFLSSLFFRNQFTVLSFKEETIVLESNTPTRVVRWDLAVYGNICATVGIILMCYYW